MRVSSLPRRAKWWAAAAATGVLVVTAWGPVYAQQAITERMTEFAFSNPTLTVSAGQPVHIVLNNAGQFPHTMEFADAAGANVTAQPGDDAVAGGASGAIDVTFSKAGTYDFWCPVDSHRDRGMVGKITVTGAAGAAGRAGGLDPIATAAGLAVLGGVSIGAGLLRRARAAL